MYSTVGGGSMKDEDECGATDIGGVMADHIILIAISHITTLQQYLTHFVDTKNQKLGHKEI